MPPSIRTTIALFLSCALAQNECYYAAGKRAGSAIIPCGGSGTTSSCCQIGDLCLSDSACWNPTYNVTYLYGCTDSTYQDAACPWKCGDGFEADAPYVGLDYCYNTTQNEWSCTHPPSNSDSIQSVPAQQCYDDSVIAFAGPSSLQPILSLPTDVGGSTVWFSEVNPTSYTLDPNYTPTTSLQVTASVPTTVEFVSTSAGTDTGTASAPIAGITTTSQTTSSFPSATADGGGSGGLSSGAKIGIGVGVGVGAVGFLALGAALFLMRRSRRGHQPVAQMEENDAGEGAYPADVKHKRPRPPSELPGTEPTPSKYDSPGGYGSGLGASSTMSNWDSPVPTYTTNEPPVGPRPLGHDRVHELG